MAEVTGFTADRMLAMENATVNDARLDGYNLILITKDLTEIDVGNVRGPVGPVGPAVTAIDDIGDVDVAAAVDENLLAFDLGSGMWVPVAPHWLKVSEDVPNNIITLDGLDGKIVKLSPASLTLETGFFYPGVTQYPAISGEGALGVQVRDDFVSQIGGSEEWLYFRSSGNLPRDIQGIAIGDLDSPRLFLGKQGIEFPSSASRADMIRFDSNNNKFIGIGSASHLVIAAESTVRMQGPTNSVAAFNQQVGSPGGPYILGQRNTTGVWLFGYNGNDELRIQKLDSAANNNTVRIYGPYDATSTTGSNLGIFSGSQLFRSTSSMRFKRDIEDLELEHAYKALDLRSVWYRSKCEVDRDNWSFYGLLAEEVAEIDPRLVLWEETPDCGCAPEKVTKEKVGDTWVPSDLRSPLDHKESCLRPASVQYDRLVPHLIMIAKDQKSKIESLEARLEALEAKV